MRPQLRSALRWRWLALVPLACCISCSGGGGPALYPVQGKVLYKDQPLKGVLVSFHPMTGVSLDTIVPTGLTGEDGTFRVDTGGDMGAPAGDYILTFICSEEVPLPKNAGMAMGPVYEDRFKGAYADKAASKIQVEVKAGENQLEAFSLK